MSSNLLFASGSTAIDPDGRKALSDLAQAIEDEEDFEVVVEGHTDDVSFTSATSPRNNWELSVLRATAVVEVLTSSSTLSPTLLTAAGRSEFHPRDQEDRNRNRRIEVVLSPKLGGLYDLYWRSDQSIGSRKVPWVIEMPPVPSLPIRLPPKVPTTMPPLSGRM